MNLEEIKKACEAASPGPWEFERQSFDGGDFAYERNDDHGMIQIYEHNFEQPMRAKFDSDFIANSRTWLPALVAEVERLRTENAELIWALERTPCTGNGDIHIQSCFKCNRLAKLRERKECDV